MEIDGLTDLRTGGLTRLTRRTDKKRTLTNPGNIYRKFGKLKLRIFQEIQSVATNYCRQCHEQFVYPALPARFSTARSGNSHVLKHPNKS